jgi:hypothetical protein
MSGVCDFIFLIDSTGSMGPCMEALKANIAVFIDQLSEGQTPIRDWRGKAIAYRDVKSDGSSWFENNPFVRNDAAALKAQLASLTPEGGGDEPESLLDALYVVATMEAAAAGEKDPDPLMWRHRRDAARVVVVFTDATYHREMSVSGAEGGSVRDVMNQLIAQKIVLLLYAPDHECYDELAQTPKSDWMPIQGPDFVQGLADYTGDHANFQKVMIALAKSMSKTAEAPLA